MKRPVQLLLVSFVAFLSISILLPQAYAQSDWLRQQQEQMRRQMQDEMRRQQQEQLRQQQDQLRRQQQDELRRQQLQQQEQQRRQQQQQDEARRQQQAQAQEQQRQQAAQQTKAKQAQEQQQLQNAQKAQQAGKPAPAGTPQSVQAKASDRMVFSNGVAKLTRPLTTEEMKRGFTGKVTSDGRALVKFQNRIFAVPASRIGLGPRRTETSAAAISTAWSPQKQSAIKSEIQKISATSTTQAASSKGGLSDSASARTSIAKVGQYLSSRPTASTALEELKSFPKLSGLTQRDAASILLSQGFASIPARSGGTVWTKSMQDGNTAAIRLDPPNKKSPAGYADSVEHAHKEIVPTDKVRDGNYEPGPHVTRLNDECEVSNCPRALHIPTRAEPRR